MCAPIEFLIVEWIFRKTPWIKLNFNSCITGVKSLEWMISATVNFCFVWNVIWLIKGRFTELLLKFRHDHKIADPLGEQEGESLPPSIKMCSSFCTICNKKLADVSDVLLQQFWLQISCSYFQAELLAQKQVQILGWLQSSVFISLDFTKLLQNKIAVFLSLNEFVAPSASCDSARGSIYSSAETEHQVLAVGDSYLCPHVCKTSIRQTWQSSNEFICIWCSVVLYM